MTEKERILGFEQDIAAISRILGSEEPQLPESLRGKNLLHLLDKEKPNKKSNIISWLFSKKAIPVYTTAVAAVLIIAILPRLTATVQNDTIAPQSMVESVESADMAVYAADAAEMQEEMAAEPELAGEDPSTYAQAPTSAAKEGTAEGTELIADDIPQAEEVGKVEEAIISESAVRESQSYMSGGSGVKNGIGGSSSNKITGEWEGYEFYWHVPESAGEENFKTILTAVNTNTKEEYISQGFSDIDMILSVIVNNNTVYILGNGQTGLILYNYTGIKGGQLNYKKTQNIPGGLMDYFEDGDYLYIMTISEKLTDDISNRIVFDDSAEIASLMVSVLDKSSGNIKTTALENSGTSFTRNDAGLQINYSTITEETRYADIDINKQNLVIIPSV